MDPKNIKMSGTVVIDNHFAVNSFGIKFKS